MANVKYRLTILYNNIPVVYKMPFRSYKEALERWNYYRKNEEVKKPDEWRLVQTHYVFIDIYSDEDKWK